MAFELSADNNLGGPFPLYPEEHDVHDFQKLFQMWTALVALVVATNYVN